MSDDESFVRPVHTTIQPSASHRGTSGPSEHFFHRGNDTSLSPNDPLATTWQSASSAPGPSYQRMPDHQEADESARQDPGTYPQHSNSQQPHKDTDASGSGVQSEGAGESSKEKPRAYIACQTCRSRKVKCDGVKPICTNCVKRREPCSYDVIPRRRGPDKNPGTRQRGPKGTASAKKRKRTAEDAEGPQPTQASRTESASHSPPPPADPPTTLDAEPPRKRKVVDIAHDPPSTTSLTNQTPWPSVPVPAYDLPPAMAIPQLRIPSISSGVSISSVRSKASLANLLAPSPSPPVGRVFAPMVSASSSFSMPASAPYSMSENHLINSAELSVFSATGVSPHDLSHPLPFNDPSSLTYNLRPVMPALSMPDFSSAHYAQYSSSETPFTPTSYPVAKIVSVDGDTLDIAGIMNTPFYETATEDSEDSSIGREPSLRFTQDSWWDAVLSLYDPISRERAHIAVTNDMHTFFRLASAWLSFINVPLFLSQFHHAEHRAMMQPALILSCLAYSAFVQGSEAEGGVLQRRKSAKLRELAQSAFDASYNAGWIDVPLAQAAWVMTLHEVSAHPETTSSRMSSSVVLLDNVIHVLGLTSIDSDNYRAPIFAVDDVPVLGRPLPTGMTNPYGHVPTPHVLRANGNGPSGYIQYQHHTQPTPFDTYREVIRPKGEKRTGCPCHALSLGSTPDAARATPLWLTTPKWKSDVSYGEIRKEEARRLVWSTLTLVAGEAAARVALGIPQLQLHVAKSENYALLYPGETLYESAPDVDAAFSSKESTWALYARTMLIWVTCTRMRESTAPSHDKASFAMKAWMETVAIEDALNEHSCDGEKATMYMTREYIFITRMLISNGYRCFIPVPQSGVDFSQLDRGKAMQWLHHQNNVALQIRAVAMKDLTAPAAKLLLRRPYLIWWYMTQMSRSLLLFSMDHSLVFAVDVALNMLPIVQYLMDMWPCPEQRRRMARLNAKLHHICMFTGKTIPSRPSLAAA